MPASRGRRAERTGADGQADRVVGAERGVAALAQVGVVHDECRGRVGAAGFLPDGAEPTVRAEPGEGRGRPVHTGRRAPVVRVR